MNSNPFGSAGGRAFYSRIALEQRSGLQRQLTRRMTQIGEREKEEKLFTSRCCLILFGPTARQTELTWPGESVARTRAGGRQAGWAIYSITHAEPIAMDVRRDSCDTTTEPLTFRWSVHYHLIMVLLSQFSFPSHCRRKHT